MKVFITGICGFVGSSIAADPRPRAFDIPWFIMDNRAVGKTFRWSPNRRLTHVLAEIATHSEQHPDRLQIAAAFS